METSDYTQFWQKIHQDAKNSHLALRVMFELTYKCNFYCRHCYVPKSWRRKKELSTQEVLEIIRQLKAAGCFYLGFTGGEIFLRRDIWKILEFSRKQGMQTILYTNGSLIDKKAAEKIAVIGVNKVDITLPGFSEEIFDKIAGVKGARNRVFAAIEHLRRRRVPLGFKTCMLKANCREIAKIKNFCARLKAPYRIDDCPSPRLDGSLAPLRFAVAQNKIFYDAKPFECASGVSQCAITPQGRLKLCPMINWPGLKVTGNNFSMAWSALPGLIKANCRRKAVKAPYACPGCVVNYSPGRNNAERNKI